MRPSEATCLTIASMEIGSGICGRHFNVSRTCLLARTGASRSSLKEWPRTGLRSCAMYVTGDEPSGFIAQNTVDSSDGLQQAMTLHRLLHILSYTARRSRSATCRAPSRFSGCDLDSWCVWPIVHDAYFAVYRCVVASFREQRQADQIPPHMPGY